jgi:hypothetical protein
VGRIKVRVATFEFTIPEQVLLNSSKVFKNPETKKEVEICLQTCQAGWINRILASAGDNVLQNSFGGCDIVKLQCF